MLLEKVSSIESPLKEELFQTLTNLENFCRQLWNLVEQNPQELSSINNKECLSSTIKLIIEIRKLILDLENPDISSERVKSKIRDVIAYNMSLLIGLYQTIIDYFMSVCEHAYYHFHKKSKPQS